MKIKNLLLLPLLAPLAGYAQTGNRLTVTPAAQPGKTVELTYNPAGTKLEKETDIKGTVYLYNKKRASYADDVVFTKAGNLLKAKLTIPDTIVLAGLKISGGKAVDNNNEKGYLIPVLNPQGKPVEGELAAEAYVKQGGGYMFGAKPDIKEAVRLYEKEIAAYPAKRNEVLSFYYVMLGATKQTEKAAAIKTELLGRFNDTKATELELGPIASTFYESARPVYDSLNKILAQRFPKGTAARTVAMATVSREKDLVKKEELYKTFVSNFNPPASIKSSLLSGMASAYAAKKDYQKFNELVAQIPDKTNVPGLLNSVAWPLAEKGENLDVAAAASKQSLDLVEAFKNNPPSYFQNYPPSARPEMIASTWRMYADTYALILYKQGKKAEALAYQEKAVGDGKSAEVNERYVTFLLENGKYKEGLAKAEEFIKSGNATAKLKEDTKALYTKVKGSENGFDTYLTGLQAIADTRVRTEILEKMLNKQATGFALKNLDGKEVSLAALKGKVVVVDFWATWCGPCKASFPGMQKMVTKYKDNPNVAFVFVDTWETDPKREALVTKFIADNKYTFNVLYDTEKTEEKGKFTVVDQFGVDGIPTKFVVDKNGVIRFKSVGYSGSDDALVTELTAMIEIASNPPAQSTSGAEE